jgi:AraC-like DNA-binding protein
LDEFNGLPLRSRLCCIEFMRMTIIAPSAEAAGLVRSFTIVETDMETSRTLLPDVGAVLGIRYAGSAALIERGKATVLSDVTLAGMRNTVCEMRTSAGGGIIVANFRENGAKAVFELPMHQLFNDMIGLNDLPWPEEIEQLRLTVAAASDSVTRARVIERFLLAHKSSRGSDATVAAAVRAMRFARGAISIRSLARQLGLSQDRFEKRFRQEVGASPKQYCSVLRFRSALGDYRADSNLAGLASEAGYYDQSHFIREFRAVTGESPRKFLRDVDYC